GWLPNSAMLRADAWTLPAARVKLDKFYAAVRGHGAIEWRDHEFHVDVAASGDPLPKQKAPPLQLEVRGHGDVQAFTVEALRATAPGLSALLDAPVTVERNGRIRGNAAAFHVEGNLAQWPWISARGTVAGDARVTAQGAPWPTVGFRLSATDLAAADMSVRS